jgi:hypothetical protein
MPRRGVHVYILKEISWGILANDLLYFWKFTFIYFQKKKRNKNGAISNKKETK